ncbi:hypothetical protein [Azospirillum doebereinerae]
MKHPITVAVLGLACALVLSGCGKKPRYVDTPLPDGQVDPFPHPYPNPSLDPKPGQPAPGVRFP